MTTKKKSTKKLTKKHRRFRIRREPLDIKKDTFEPAHEHALVSGEVARFRWGPFIATVIERGGGFPYVEGTKLLVREGDYIQMGGEDHWIIQDKDVLGCIN